MECNYRRALPAPLHLWMSIFLCCIFGAAPARAQTPGGVLVWGSNSYGQSTVPLEVGSDAVAVAVGSFHTVALKVDGSVVSWGYNDNVVGEGIVPEEARTGVRAIAASWYFTLALKTDGAVIGWGSNQYNQSAVPLEATAGVTAIAAGMVHALALKSNGLVVAWGDPRYNKTTVPPAARSGVKAIAAGEHHSVALKTNGSVVAWGTLFRMVRGSFGEAYLAERLVPWTVESGVKAIAAGDNHVVALKTDGSIVTWGFVWNGSGYGPSSVPAEARNGVVAVAAGNHNSAALKSDGSLVVWGYNSAGQSTIPAAAKRGVKAFAVGGAFAAAVVVPAPPAILVSPMSQTVPAGQRFRLYVEATGYPLIYQWRKDGQDIMGANEAIYTEFAHPSMEGEYTVRVSNSLGSELSMKPATLAVTPFTRGGVIAWGSDAAGQVTVPLSAQKGVIAVAAGENHTLALKADGSVLAWGSNQYGQSAVPAEALSDVVSIDAGGKHSAAVKADGSVVAWGAGMVDTGMTPDYGQALVPAAAQTGVIAIATGIHHTAALKADGTVVAWGSNVLNQSTVPAEFQGHFKAIAATGDHTAAVTINGAAVAWGSNLYGETTPLRTSTQRGIVSVAAGDLFTMALKSDGRLMGWGNNGAGQIQFPPAAQGGDLVAIAAGSAHAVALKAGGGVVAWGLNTSGQATVPLVARSEVIAIAAGRKHTVALVREPPAPSAYSAWQVHHFGPAAADPTVGGDLVDGDADGVVNLLEFALLGDPWLSDDAILPEPVSSSGLRQIRFVRPAPADVAYAVEASLDLVTWTVIATLPANASNWIGDAVITEFGQTSSRNVTVQDVASPLSGPRFLRLSIRR